MGVAATLFNCAKLFELIDNIPSTEGPMWNLVKIRRAVSEKTFKDYMILYMCIALGQGHITPVDKSLIVTKRVSCFDHTL